MQRFYTITILFKLFLISNCFSQNKFSEGFKIGYKEGYCYLDIGCVFPLPPITPVPNAFENIDNFKDGYNRGFTLGTSDKRLKMSREPSIPKYRSTYDTKLNKIESNYVPKNIDWGTIFDLYARLEAQINEINEKRKYLISYLADIKNNKLTESDLEFKTTIGKAYDRLVSMEGDDMIDRKAEIDQIGLSINKGIDNFNNKIILKKKELFEIGMTNYNLKNYGDAITYFSQVLNFEPDYQEAIIYRGLSNFFLSKYPESIFDFDNYLKSNNKNQIAYEYRGWANYQIKSYYKALNDFEKGCELDKGNWRFYYAKGSCKSEIGDNTGAIVEYDIAISLNPEISMLYNNKGYSYYKSGNFIDAMKNYNTAIKLDPTNWNAYDSRMELNFKLNKLNDCLADCKKTIELNPNCSNAYLYRGRLNYKKGLTKQACIDWKNANELGNIDALNFLTKYCK